LNERLTQSAGEDFGKHAENVRRVPKADTLKQLKRIKPSVDDLAPAMNRRLKPRTEAVPPKPKLGKVLGDNNPKHIEAVSKYRKAQQEASETPFSKTRRIGKELVEEGKRVKDLREQIDKIGESNQRKMKHALRPLSPRPPPPTLAGGGGARSTTQSAVKSKQSPMVSPDSTSPKAKGTRDLASVRRSPGPRPWEDEDWMTSNLGTADTPLRESSAKKSPRLTRAQRKAMEIDYAEEGGDAEGQNEVSDEEGETPKSSKKGKREEKKASKEKAKQEMFVKMNQYLIDVFKKAGISNIKDLQGDKDNIPDDLREELYKNYGKKFNRDSTLDTVYNWYDKLDPTKVELRPAASTV
jgi:hypothetical protein